MPDRKRRQSPALRVAVDGIFPCGLLAMDDLGAGPPDAAGDRDPSPDVGALGLRACAPNRKVEGEAAFIKCIISSACAQKRRPTIFGSGRGSSFSFSLCAKKAPNRANDKNEH